MTKVEMKIKLFFLLSLFQLFGTQILESKESIKYRNDETVCTYKEISCTHQQWHLIEDKLLNRITKYNDSLIAFATWLSILACIEAPIVALHLKFDKQLDPNLSNRGLYMSCLSCTLAFAGLLLSAWVNKKYVVNKLNKKSKIEALKAFFDQCTDEELSLLLPELKAVYEKYKQEGPESIEQAAHELIRILKKSPKYLYPSQ